MFDHVSLFPLIGRSSYGVTITHYDVIKILFTVGQFVCSNYEQKSYKNVFVTRKNDALAGLTRAQNNPVLIGLKGHRCKFKIDKLTYPEP